MFSLVILLILIQFSALTPILLDISDDYITCMDFEPDDIHLSPTIPADMSCCHYLHPDPTRDMLDSDAGCKCTKTGISAVTPRSVLTNVVAPFYFIQQSILYLHCMFHLLYQSISFRFLNASSLFVNRYVFRYLSNQLEGFRCSASPP